jgi:hypothetical protein
MADVVRNRHRTDDDIGPMLVSVGETADDTRHILPGLHRLDVLGTRTFLPSAFREGHPLAFT